MSGGTRKFFVNAGAMLGVGFVQRSIGLVLIAVLSRVLDPKGLGSFTFAQSTSNTFAGLSRLGADMGLHVVLAGLKLPAEKARAEAVLGQVLTLILLLSGGVALGMVLLAQTIASGLFDAPELAAYVVVSATLVLGQMLSQYCYTAYAGLQAFQRYSRITMMSSLVSAVFTAAGAVAYGPWGCAIAFALAQGLSFVLLADGLRRETAALDIVVRLRLPTVEARSLLAVGLPFYLSGVLLLPTEFVSLGLLTRSTGVEGLGELRVTQSLMSLAAIVPIAMAGPMITHLAATDLGDGNPEPVLTQLKITWILALLIVAVIAGIWPLAVDLIFGASYPTARSHGILALAAFVPMLLTTVLTAALLVLKRSGFLLLVGGLQASVVGGAAWFLIPTYGLGGFLVAQALGFFAAAMALGINLAGRYGRAVLRSWMAPFALMTIVTWAALFGVLASDPTRAMRAACAAVLLLAMLVIFYFVLTEGEKARLHALGLQVRAHLPHPFRVRRRPDPESRNSS